MKVYVNAGHDRQLDSGAVNRRTGASRCSKQRSETSAATSAPTPAERVAS